MQRLKDLKKKEDVAHELYQRCLVACDADREREITALYMANAYSRMAAVTLAGIGEGDRLATMHINAAHRKLEAMR